MRLWYIISDIHGSYRAFRNLLLHAQLINENSQWIGGEACLFLLGDYITSGCGSKQVIDLIRTLEKQVSNQIITLVGNHELLLLRAIHSEHHRQEWLANPEHWQTIASWAAANEELGNLLRLLQIDPLSTQTIAEIYQATAKSDPNSDSLIQRVTQRWRFNHPAFTTNLWDAWDLFLRIIEEDGTLAWIEGLPVAHQTEEWGFFHAGPPIGFDGGIDNLNNQFDTLRRGGSFEHPLLGANGSPASPVSTRRWWEEASQVELLFKQFEIERCAFGHDPKAIEPRGILGSVWNRAVSTDSYMRGNIEGMIRISDNCADAIYTHVGISTLQDIYPQRTFFTVNRLID
jgi:hypothetical protein